MIAACIEFHAVKTGLSGTLCKFGKELNKLGYFFNCQFTGIPSLGKSNCDSGGFTADAA